MPPDVFRDARFVTAADDTGRAPILTKRFRLGEDGAARPNISSATLCATAHGVYEATLNGTPVTDNVLSPGWTSYQWRLQYQQFDVTPLLQADNQLCFLVGNGWWRGNMGPGSGINYGDRLGVLAVLEVTFDDGRTERIVSDDSWSATLSKITSNSHYQGQSIDFGLNAEPAELHVLDPADDTVVPQVGPSIRRQQTVRPVAIWQSPAGNTLVDFGQNLVGWLRFTVQGPAGQQITLRHAEVLENGELGVRPLRSARATDVAVLSGGQDHFEPMFTFHGFRYAEVTGWPRELQLQDLEAVVVHSDLDRTGHFQCSNELVNQLVQNVVWSQKGNFLDIPTDCPQRNERLGWTGDIAAFAPTATYNFDVADFLHKWLLDLYEETRAYDGVVPVVVPDVIRKTKGATAVWGDAAVWVPEVLWNSYGDRYRLEAHYPAMVLHTDLVRASLSETGLWDTGFQFGDWLDPDAPPDRPAAAKADQGVVSTACAYRTAQFTAETAAILDKPEDAKRYATLADELKEAFNAHYVSDEGRITSDCVTVYALAIRFGLLDQELRRLAGNRLAELVRDRDYTISTGFAGTPYVTWALSDTGHTDDAYRLLLQTACPSWLYPVTMGATTIWERWDSQLPDGSINPGTMTSFNHYALGAVADWLYGVVAGIQPVEPGYAKVRIAPCPGPGLDWASASVQTRQGLVASSWEIAGDGIKLDVQVPENLPAEIVLPSGETHNVIGGQHTYESSR